MIVNNPNQDDLIARFSNSSQPGLLARYLPSEAAERGTSTDPWTGENTPTAEVKGDEKGDEPNGRSASKSNGVGIGKAAGNVAMGLAGVDPAIAIAGNLGYDLATGNPNATRNALGSGVRQGMKAGARAVAGAAAPFLDPFISMAVETTKPSHNYGRAGVTSAGRTVGALIGAVFGPVGAIGGSLLGGALSGKSYTEGAIGDMFNARSGEKTRDALEDKGLSKKEVSNYLASLGKKDIDYSGNSEGFTGGSDKDGGPSPTSTGRADTGAILENAGWATGDPMTALGRALGRSWEGGSGGDGGSGIGAGDMAGGPDAGSVGPDSGGSQYA